MKSVFADTHFWIAFLDARDPWHAKAGAISQGLGRVWTVTTDAVLSEVLTFLSAYGVETRRRAAAFARGALARPDVEVVPQTRETFLSALALYEARPDKTYSLVDCLSMQIMRERRIRQILTHDQHFAQEGFTVLMRE